MGARFPNYLCHGAMQYVEWPLDCVISHSLSLAVSQTNARWTIFKICAGQQCMLLESAGQKLLACDRPAQHHPPWLQHWVQVFNNYQ